MKTNFKLAVCQMKVEEDKKQNITKALEMIKKSAKNKSDMVILPEMFNCPYDNSKFAEYAETKDNSNTLNAISNAAKKYGVYIIAGSIPELNNEKIYNSSFTFDKNGEIIGIYRKIHLFDIDIPNKITFKESDVLTAGNKITVIKTDFCKIGIGICYDIRFPEILRLMTLKGAELIVIPGAFNMITGPAHWETLIRSRAIDNQVYVVAASPAQNKNLSYVGYGNSMIVEPWGNILARANSKEEIIYSEIDLSYINEIREELPLLKNIRNDIYEIREK
ncbi:MAG: carbon-nitrogen hydrolase family protein [Methanobacterium sp.]|uniref:carbon-nitrogen hydrolase family protein n=1 Tax=Methanobacterium sp. TaxID=2164 RepID=UPI003D65116E|nr:carbon-nitrogen hydrolase family protein [Methanobacterium sp.]